MCVCAWCLQVLRNKPDFRRKPWPSISNSAKDFVKKLLVKDPRARLTAAQALCKSYYSAFEVTIFKRIAVANGSWRFTEVFLQDLCYQIVKSIVLKIKNKKKL